MAKGVMALVVGSILLSLVFVWRTGFEVAGGRCYVLFDDAMISMRYARNLMDGHGLVWNPGGERVEGYSNLLWMLWMAVIHSLPIGERLISLPIMLSGVAILAGNLLVVGRLAHELSGRNGPVVIATILLTGFFYPLIFWTLRGNEVGLLVLLLDGSLLTGVLLVRQWEARRVGLAAGLAALAVLTRDDALPACLFMALGLGIMAPPGRRTITGAVIALGGLLAFLGHGIFRYSYYGEVLPNTYYLKLSGVPLKARLLRGFGFFRQLVVVQLALPFLMAAFYLIRNRGRVSRGVWLVVGILIVQCSYSVWVGGDAWEWLGFSNRYITIAMPGLMLLAALGLDEIKRIQTPAQGLGRVACAISGVGLLVAAASVLLFRSDHAVCWGRYSLFQAALVILCCSAGAGCLFAALTPSAVDGLLKLFRTRAAVRWLVVAGLLLIINGSSYGKWVRSGAPYSELEEGFTQTAFQVRSFTDAQARIAVVWAGIPGYFLHRTCVDLLGKNDAHIAHLPSHLPFIPGHSKWDYDYSIGELRPDLVWELWPPSDENYRKVADLGYERLSNSMMIRKDASGVDEARLEQLGVHRGMRAL